jgi:hypothetical protein
LNAIDGPTILNRFSIDPPMPDRFVRLARTRLDVADLDLARNLGVTVGSLAGG